MKTAAVIFMFIATMMQVHSAGSTPLRNVSGNMENVSSAFLNQKFESINNEFISCYLSYELYPTAIKFAWQIRAANQFGNPVTANSGIISLTVTGRTVAPAYFRNNDGLSVSGNTAEIPELGKTERANKNLLLSS